MASPSEEEDEEELLSTLGMMTGATTTSTLSSELDEDEEDEVFLCSFSFMLCSPVTILALIGMCLSSSELEEEELELVRSTAGIITGGGASILTSW